MRVNEILREQRLDEAIPFAIASIITAISGLLTAWTALDILQFIKKWSDDPETLSDDEWKDALIDISLIAVPALAKFGKVALAKFFPSSAVQWFKTTVLRKAASTPAAATTAAAGTTAATGAATAAKQAVKNPAVVAAAKKTVSSLPSKFLAALQVGIGLKLVYDYWEKIHDLEDQYERRIKQKDMTTRIFGPTGTDQDVYDVAQRLRNQYIGELTLAVGAAIASLRAGKAVEFVGKMLGTVGSAAGGKLVGGAIQLPFNIASTLIKLSGPGLALFMQTESGKKFLANEAVSTITTGVGAVTSEGLSLLRDTISELGKMAGIDTSKVASAGASKITAPPGTAAQPVDTSIPRSLRKEVDPSNPKIIYIGGVQITDQNGYQLVGDEYLMRLRREFAASKVPDPTLNIKKPPA